MFQAYLNATEAAHVYLLNLSQDADVSIRFRNYIFPDETPPVIYADIGYETYKGKLSHSSRTQVFPARIA